MSFSETWSAMSKRERYKVRHRMQRDAIAKLSTRMKLVATPAQISAAAKKLTDRAFSVSRVA